MAVTQTKTARNLSSGQVIEPQLILEIEGITGDDGSNLIFGTSDVLVPLTFDAEPPFEFDETPPLEFDSFVKGKNSRNYISWKKTTKSIKSQLLIDKGGAGSIQNFKVELINKSNELTNLFKSGNLINDIFGQRCELYLNYVGGSHKADSQLIFQGIIKGISQEHGVFLLDVSHPDQLKRQDLFEQSSTALDGAIDDTQTTITVDDSSEFVIPTTEQQAIGFKNYLKIDDEFMQILSVAGNDFTVLRNQLESSSASHDDDADITSHYRLTAQPIEMMLRLMLSNEGNTPYLSDFNINNFVRTDSGDFNNALWVQNVDLFQKYQITKGDLISSSGASNAANNFTDRLVLDVVNIPEGSYILIDGADLTLETATSANISIKSQYNLYPIGLGMLPRDLDMSKIIEVKNEVDLGLPQIAIDISEEINVKEFMERELAKPNALYFIPTARVAVKFTRPPLAGENLVTLSPSNIINIESLSLKRTFGQYFYNAISYKYEFNPVKDKYEQYKSRINTDSIGRVGLGRKALNIEANGFRQGGDVVNIIDNISRRLLDRYKFGARYMSGVQVAWRDSNIIEIGDVVNLTGIKIPNLETGEATLNDILFEVVNKSTGLKDGKITLDLLETNFSLDDRYAVFSPSSNVASGLTSNSVIIEPSFSTSGADKEKDKWTDYIPCKVQLHNVDYTVSQVLTLTGFNPQNENEAQFTEALTITPDNTVMDFAPYNECTEKQKLIHTFISKSENITSGTSSTIFDMDTTDLFEGDTIIIKRDDFTESPETVILDISGTTVTVETDLGFTPNSTDLVESGFPSDEKPFYRFV